MLKKNYNAVQNRLAFYFTFKAFRSEETANLPASFLKIQAHSPEGVIFFENKPWMRLDPTHWG